MRQIIPPYIGEGRDQPYILPDSRFEMPELFVPGKRPVGNKDVKINKSFISNGGFFCLMPSNRLSSFKDLTGRGKITVSDNHGGPPYEHWHAHPLGVREYYGTNYTDGECLDITGITSTCGLTTGTYLEDTVVAPFSFGAVFRVFAPDDVDDYCLVGDRDPLYDAHMYPMSGLGILNENTIRVRLGYTSRSNDITVPNLIDGKLHAVTSTHWHTGTENRAYMILDGILYPEVVNVHSQFYYYQHFGGISTYDDHHNKNLNGVVEAIWYSPVAQNKSALIEWTKDPYQILEPT